MILKSKVQCSRIKYCSRSVSSSGSSCPRHWRYLPPLSSNLCVAVLLARRPSSPNYPEKIQMCTQEINLQMQLSLNFAIILQRIDFWVLRMKFSKKLTSRSSVLTKFWYVYVTSGVAEIFSFPDSILQYCRRTQCWQHTKSTSNLIKFKLNFLYLHFIIIYTRTSKTLHWVFSDWKILIIVPIWTSNT